MDLAGGFPSLRLVLASRAAPTTGSGTGRVLERIGDGLAARGHEVRYAVPEAAPPLGSERDAALAAIRSRMATHHHALTSWWGEWRPDLVYIELADEFGHVARQVAREASIPVIGRFHRIHAAAPPARRDEALMQLLAFHRSLDATIIQTDELRHWLAGLGVPRVVSIENGIDARRFHPLRRDAALRAQWGADEAAVVLLWVGRLLTEKDPSLFAEVCDAARAVNPRTRAVVVGDGVERERLRARLPWATFTGVLGDDELSAAYASADAFIFTSPPEGIDTWGNVVAEAMASGLAPIAFSFGAAGTWIEDGHCGRLVVPGDRAGFIAAAVDAVRSIQRLRDMGRTARAVASRHPWSASVARYAELIEDIVQSTTRAGIDR